MMDVTRHIQIAVARADLLICRLMPLLKVGAAGMIVCALLCVAVRLADRNNRDQ